jgi:hypothetical protein
MFVYATYIVIFLAILFVGRLLLRKIWRELPKNRLAEPPYSSSGGSWSIAVTGVLSIILAIAAGFLSKMSTPGWWIAGTSGNLAKKFGFDLDLWLFLAVPIMDAAIFFAVLWGGYSLWMRDRRN